MTKYRRFGLRTAIDLGMRSEHQSPDAQPALLEPVKKARIVINGGCIVYETEGARVVMAAGVPVFKYHKDDKAAENLILVQILVCGLANSCELASAFDKTSRTLRRMRKRYEEEGAEGLLPKKTGPTGQRLSDAQDKAIKKWHAQGYSGREIARRLGVATGTVSKAFIRLGLPKRPRGRPRKQKQLPLSLPVEDQEPAVASSVPNEPVVLDEPHVEGCIDADKVAGPDQGGTHNGDGTLDQDPCHRDIDRMLAHSGMLNDAVPFFAPGADIPRLGVLLAMPMLVASGLFEEAERLYGDIGPAFYGLRTSLLTMVVLALLRVKHPENIKEYAPPELGRVLGLDRAPEVKTLRRKLAKLAEGPCEKLLSRLVHRRVESRSEALGYLYVDGHVRVYSGKHKLPKTHIARMRIALPATQDVWVNDANGDPLFFVTEKAHPSLVGALEPLLKDIRAFIGKRRVTVVFDRGGWSPRLFQKMYDAGFDVITYRKGRSEPVAIEAFVLHKAPGAGVHQQWELHDQEVTVGKNFKMRQVTRRKGDHQTQVLTTRRDLSAAEVAYRMFERWRQENFFKYMRQEFAIDAMVQYGFEPDDPSRDVPNPAWNEANKKLVKATAALRKLEAKFGAAARENKEKKCRTMRGFKIANGTELGIPMRAAKAEVAALKATRDAIPKRLTVGELKNPPVRLLSARKRLSDGLKMLTYQIETDMYRAITPHYARASEEGRTLISAALQSSGELVCTDGELRINLAPQSSPHRSRALAHLCAILNDTQTCFPGTAMRLHFTVRGVEVV